MKTRFSVALLVILFSLNTSVCQGSLLKVGGGGAALNGFILPFVDTFNAESGLKVATRQSTPAQGLIDLDAGYINVAVAAVPLDFMIKGAIRNGISLNPAQFHVHEIGQNKTLVFVHKSILVKELSKKQLQDIFTGRITNWAKVGGPDQPVVVVWGIATPGQNELFIRQILDGKQVTRKHIEATDYQNIFDVVAKTPGAIGIDPQGFASVSTWNPKTPVVSSTVIAVTKGSPSEEADKLISYVKDFF